MTRATSFTACKEAVETGSRLTRQQGRALLAYAMMQEDRVQACWLRKGQIASELEALREDYARLAAQWNELIQMIEKALDIRVYSNTLDTEKNLLWTVERDGVVVSTGHASVTQAYASVLNMHHSQRDRLTCINRAGTLFLTTE